MYGELQHTCSASPRSTWYMYTVCTLVTLECINHPQALSFGIKLPSVMVSKNLECRGRKGGGLYYTWWLVLLCCSIISITATVFVCPAHSNDVSW